MKKGGNGFVDFIVRKTQLVSLNCSSNFGITDGEMNGFIYDENDLLTCSDCLFPSKLDRGSYIISIAKAFSKKSRT